jgi:hypothetical protein
VGYLAGQTSQGISAVAVGYQAGINNQGTLATAVGNVAGDTSQGSSAVAVGTAAGRYNQGAAATALGVSAGATSQGNNAIAVGNNAGTVDQGGSAIAVGLSAGQTSQGANSVAMGYYAGQTAQAGYATAVGRSAGETSQGSQATAVGYLTGRYNQGEGATAVGIQAGQTSQGSSAVAVGDSAGVTVQGVRAVAVGGAAGFTRQGNYAIAIGWTAGYTSQGTRAVAVGINAGNSNQGNYAVAVGDSAGLTSQGANAVAVGYAAGLTAQGTEAVAVGLYAGNTSQGNLATAVGRGAAQFYQGSSAVAIGYLTGRYNQGDEATAVGRETGYQNQGTYATAIGYLAGRYNQGSDALAAGRSAGETSQGSYATAIGYLAGRYNQGSYATALGYGAGATSQHNNTMVLNATGSALNTTQASSFYVKPVRGGDITASALAYTSAGEIVEETNVHFDASGNVGIGTASPSGFELYNTKLNQTFRADGYNIHRNNKSYIYGADTAAPHTLTQRYAIRAARDDDSNPRFSELVIGATADENSPLPGSNFISFLEGQPLYLGSHPQEDFMSDWTTISNQAYPRMGSNTFSPHFTLLSSGNVGIGTTSPGQKLEISGTAVASRLKMNGDGYIGRYYVASGVDSGASLHFTGGAIIPANYNFGLSNDGSITFGLSSYRWGQIYSTSSTISTSDRNLKQDIADITDSERRVASKIIPLLKTFRMKDAVEKKSDEARTHTGIIAQDLIAAFESEGLDAHRYGLFCYDEKWTVDGEHELTETVYQKNGSSEYTNEDGDVIKYTADDEGVEAVKVKIGTFASKDTPGAILDSTMYSIRYEELLCFIVSAMATEEKVATLETQLASVLARLDALESA